MNTSANELDISLLRSAPAERLRLRGMIDWVLAPRNLWLFAFLYCVFNLTLSLCLYNNLRMYIWDIGDYDQAIWNTANGRWFSSSIAIWNLCFFSALEPAP